MASRGYCSVFALTAPLAWVGTGTRLHAGPNGGLTRPFVPEARMPIGAERVSSARRSFTFHRYSRWYEGCFLHRTLASAPTPRL